MENKIIQSDALLELRNLKKYFPIQSGFMRRTTGYVKAVDDVSFTIKPGETYGLVGESGCGKTTLGRCLMRAIEPTGGEVLFRTENNGVVDIRKLNNKDLRTTRKEIQMIFQDPYSSLNPRMTVLEIISEPIICNHLLPRREIRDRVIELTELVGLDPRHLERYPHAFSGGQRQRIGIARALATNPRFVVCDEAVSALDVSVQAQIINLLLNLQKRLGLSYLFISHDLSVVKHMSDNVGVMYVGRMVETAPSKELFANPRHPYSRALLGAKPVPDPRSTRKRQRIMGEVANPANPPSGCYFHPRCPYAKDICSKEAPKPRQIGENHMLLCHFDIDY